MSAIDFTTWKSDDLRAYIGGLSNPSKMPCQGYNLPAWECVTGSKLAKVAGSTCNGCYARKGRYVFANVKAAAYRRLSTLSREGWAEAFAALLNRKRTPWFRWHDSGDIMSVAHLAAIVRVAELTPWISHWLPTREYRFVAEYVANGGTFPPNLTVRLSAPMIGGKAPSFPRLRGMVAVSVVSNTDADYPDAFRCGAALRGGKCGECRACWNRDVTTTDYPKH